MSGSKICWSHNWNFTAFKLYLPITPLLALGNLHCSVFCCVATLPCTVQNQHMCLCLFVRHWVRHSPQPWLKSMFKLVYDTTEFTTIFPHVDATILCSWSSPSTGLCPCLAGFLVPPQVVSSLPSQCVWPYLFCNSSLTWSSFLSLFKTLTMWYTDTDTHACTHTHTHPCTHTQIHTCTHTHTNTHTCAHTQI